MVPPFREWTSAEISSFTLLIIHLRNRTCDLPFPKYPFIPLVVTIRFLFCSWLRWCLSQLVLMWNFFSASLPIHSDIQRSAFSLQAVYYPGSTIIRVASTHCDSVIQKRSKVRLLIAQGESIICFQDFDNT